MTEQKPAIEQQQAVAPAPVAPQPTETNVEEMEKKIAALEAEKAKAIEEGANYKLAFLKEKQGKNDDLEDETEDERVARIVAKQLADQKVAQIEAEKADIVQKLVKENKELKLANLNKPNTPPATIGTHTETPRVQDTIITPEQLAAFKARGWTDKDIERYKKNLGRYGGR